MKGILAMGIAAGLTLAGAAAAQTQQPKTNTMESESTTKHTGPGKDTKQKTQTVIGVVKEYDAGKKIVVTGPKKKNYSFDLDENAAVKGDITVGEKVKVTYTKSSEGQKVTTVAPYTAKKTKKETKAA